MGGRVFRWLETAGTFMQGLSRLLRYVLVSVLVLIALIVSVTGAVAGEFEPVSGLLGALPEIGGSQEEAAKPLRPLFNFQIEPTREVCPPGKSI